MADGWQNPRYTQLDKGALSVHYGVRRLSSGAAHIEHFNRALHISASPPEGAFSIGVLLSQGGLCRFGGRAWEAHQIVLVRGGCEVEHCSKRPASVLYFDLELDRLRDAARKTLRTDRLPFAGNAAATPSALESRSHDSKGTSLASKK